MYEKQTWKNGDVITEGKLNHIEDGIATGGGIYTYGEISLFDGEVTTVAGEAPFANASITLQGDLPKSDISVTFNGQDYTLPYGYAAGPGDYWGELAGTAPSFTNYPVFIRAGESVNLMTPEAGTYSLKINETVQKLEVNDSFASAIATGMVVNVTSYSDGYALDKKYDEIYSAVMKGQNVIFINTTEVLPLFGISSNSITLLRESGIDTQGNVLFGRLSFIYETEDGYPSTFESN